MRLFAAYFLVVFAVGLPSNFSGIMPGHKRREEQRVVVKFLCASGKNWSSVTESWFLSLGLMRCPKHKSGCGTDISEEVTLMSRTRKGVGDQLQSTQRPKDVFSVQPWTRIGVHPSGL